MLRRPFDIVEILLGFLAIAGISIVFHFDPHYKLGIIISLFSAFLASVFPILNRQILQKMDAETATRYQLSGGFILSHCCCRFICTIFRWISYYHLYLTLPGYSYWVFYVQLLLTTFS
ncbi:MAG: hypothetical protein WDM78_04395 [Puia sp.]